ncbi:hypothetical protein ABPG72_000842 [Tetrahymena utriculariae]
MSLDVVLQSLIPKKATDDQTIYTLLKQYAVLQVSLKQNEQFQVEIGQELNSVFQKNLNDESIKNNAQFHRKYLFCLLYLYQQLKQNKIMVQIDVLQGLFEFSLSLSLTSTQINYYFVLKTFNKILVKQGGEQLSIMINEFLNAEIILESSVLQFYKTLKEKVEHADIESHHAQHLKKQEILIDFYIEYVQLNIKKGYYAQISESVQGVTKDIFKVYIWNEDTTSIFQKICSSEVNGFDFSKYNVNSAYNSNYFNKMREILFKYFRTLFQSQKTIQDGISNEFRKRYLQQRNSLSSQPDKQHNLLCFEVIKFVELLHFNNKYDLNDEIIKNEVYWSDLKNTLELYENFEACKQGVNALNGILESVQIRFNEKDIKNDKNLLEYSKIYTKKYKTFVDLYITLDSFAVHLIKSLWPQLVNFFQKDPQGINKIVEKIPILHHLNSEWPVYILFKKSIYHNNQSIVKCCVKYFLKMEEIDIDDLQDLIYDYAVPILNNCLFYNDATLDADSKFYNVVQTFFLNAYQKILKNLKEKLEQSNQAQEYEEQRKKLLNHHLKRLIQAVCKHIVHPQAVCAFLLVFSNLNEQSTSLGSEEIKQILDFTERVYARANVRKRTIFAKGLISLILNHLDIQNIKNEEIYDLILNFPQQTFEWISIKQFDGPKHLIELDIAKFNDELNSSFQYKSKLLYFLIKNAEKLNISQTLIELRNEISQQKIKLQNTEDEHSYQDMNQNYLKFLSFINILLEAPSYTHAIKHLIDNSKEIKKELEFLYQFSIDGKLAEFTSSWLFNYKISDIYTNSYRPYQESTQYILQLKELIKLFKNTKEMKKIHEQLDSVSADLLSYLMLRISEKDIDSKQYNDFSYYQNEILDLFYNLYYYAISPELLRPTHKLSTSLSKTIKNMFEQLILLLNRQAAQSHSNESILLLGEEQLVCLYFEILSCICKSNLEIIQQSQKSASNSIFIDDLIFDKGLQLVLILSLYDSPDQNYPVIKQLASKRGFLSKSHALLCNLMSLLSFSNEIYSNPSFTKIIDKVVGDAYYLADVFDFNKLDELFIMLKYVYNPYLISHLNDENQEQLIKDFKNLFELCFNQNILTTQLNYITYKEVHYMYEWALDQTLFYNPYIIKSDIIQHFIKVTLKAGQNNWLLQRKVVDKIVSVFYSDPALLVSFEKTIYRFIKIKEYRGFDNGMEFYKDELEIPLANELKTKCSNNIEYYGAFPRFIILKLLENIVIWINNCVNNSSGFVDEATKAKFKTLIDFYIKYTQNLLERNYQKKYQKSRNSLLPNTNHYNSKIRMWQCLCVIKDFFTEKVMNFIKNTFDQSEYNVDKLIQDIKEKIWGILDFNNQINIRQYIEVFTLHLYNEFPAYFEQSIIDGIKEKNNRSQYSIPLVFMAGYQLCRKPNNLKAKEVLSHLIPYTGSHVAYLRSIAQYFISKFTQANEEQIKDDVLLKNLNSFFTENKESIKMRKTFDKIVEKFEKVIENFNTEQLLSIDMDGNGEVIHENVIEEIKNVCMNLIYQLKEHEDAPPKKDDLWRLKTQEFIQDIPIPDLSEVTNFQRKIDVVQNELDQIEAEKKKRRKEKDIIVVASLLEKIPNFGHLTRTSEIFGVSSLVIPNKAILEEEGFKAISVTAEKWLPIQEVKEKDLMAFLILKKKLGYKIVGLEQTSKSKMIQHQEFPDKCILLLGREKTGIPLEYIEILDECVEIPQFGQVRSLNVHISAVICIWEFVKQKFIKE